MLIGDFANHYALQQELIMTQHDEDENTVAAKSMGAHGFIAQKAVSAEFVTGIMSVNEGSYCPAYFAEIGDSQEPMGQGIQQWARYIHAPITRGRDSKLIGSATA